MKKILAFIVCTVLLICAFPLTAFAEGDPVDSIENSVEEVDTSPTEEESASEEEISGEKTMPNITTEDIVAYIKAHFEEISVVLTLIGTLFYNIRKHKLLNKSISATNLNAITVAENSELTMKETLAMIEGYKTEFTNLLNEYRASEEEKQKLVQTLNEAMTYIKTARIANEEFANELAELLVLANIPNSKKDELYSRHIAKIAALHAIEEAEHTEVIASDGGEET
jgi:hypothetical protein